MVTTGDPPFSETYLEPCAMALNQATMWEAMKPLAPVTQTTMGCAMVGAA
jgi:hypothetical protein